MNRSYLAIDLKSFYASVECVDKGMDPITTNLVVADLSRTEKTICLAVSPSLKKLGIGGRPRLFEVSQKIKEVNLKRRYNIPNGKLTGRSVSEDELNMHPDWAVDYLIAVPRMARYIEVSKNVYEIYLKYVAPEDIHVYSIDEVFMDVTAYLTSYKMTAHELAMTIICDVLQQTGITATAGIGTNLYLCKVAMDIVAKKASADKDGVRIAELDEMSYRRQLWNHKPLSDFWRVGRGIAEKLSVYGIDTMGKLARCSLKNETLLYQLFGINAELLIDHAWGWESCTIDIIKAHKPESSSFCCGQVLHCTYEPEKAKVVIQEMAESMALKLVSKQLVTNQLALTVSYDTKSQTCSSYCGEITTDRYGRRVPKHTHSTINLDRYTSSSKIIMNASRQLFDKITNKNLMVRRLSLSVNNVIPEDCVPQDTCPQQLDLFTDNKALYEQKLQEQEFLNKERHIQQAQLEIRKRFGKNAILRGLNFQDGATAKERNAQIGGHKA